MKKKILKLCLPAGRFLKKRASLILVILILAGSAIGFENPQISPKVASSQNANQTAYEDFHLLIPKIGVSAPVIADVDGTNKQTYFKALEKGVAHFKGTAKPGENSNIFIFGHSSFYRNQPGEYKEVFRNLEELQKGDEIILWYNQKEYQYLVSDIKTVNPTDVVEVLKKTAEEQLSLMTCVPPGTTLKRLVVVAQPKL